ncbi:MAG: hypothetical protein R3E79_57400 [Caldilineaceae bacterium]
MAQLTSHFPRTLPWRRLPLSRDQMMLLMAAINEFFLGLDTYLAHQESGTIVPREWIPILFGIVAGGLLLIAGLVALRYRALASVIATLTLLASIGVGLLGAYFHLARAAQPFAPSGQRLTLDLLVWAPPVLGPMAFAMVGILGISAAWIEAPPGSGSLVLWGPAAPIALQQNACLFLHCRHGAGSSARQQCIRPCPHRFSGLWRLVGHRCRYLWDGERRGHGGH